MTQLNNITPLKFKNLWEKLHPSLFSGIDPISMWGNKSYKTKFFLNQEKDGLSILENKIQVFFGLRSSREWRKFDLTAYYEHKHFDNLKDGNGDEDKKFHDTPRDIEILLEHENEPLCAREEMTKLVYERARLKILITYITYEGIKEILQHNFGEIIKQSNAVFKENQETNYLLILGEINKTEIRWFYFQYDIEGKKIEL